jgi:GR25 family glycosyltransferase involved in LPS biosynthesis
MKHRLNLRLRKYSLYCLVIICFFYIIKAVSYTSWVDKGLNILLNAIDGGHAAVDDLILDSGEAPPNFIDRFSVYCINMPKETDKLERFRKEAKKFDMPFKPWAGVHADQELYDKAVKDKLYAPNLTPYLWGNIGASMAHMTMWKHAFETDETDYVLGFEDDEVLNKNLLGRLSKIIEKINEKDGDFDFVNLNVLRPFGDEITPNLLKVNGNKTYHGTFQVPNVWLSAYLLKRKNIPRIIKKVYESGYSGNYAFSRHLSNVFRTEGDLRGWVVRTNYLTTHAETQSSRTAANAHGWLWFCSRLINC